jgi:hypothetical protein
MTKTNTKNKTKKPKQPQFDGYFDLDGYYIENGISYKIYKDKHGKSKMKRAKN